MFSVCWSLFVKLSKMSRREVTDLHGTVCPAVLVCEPVSQSREGSIVIKVNKCPNIKDRHFKIYLTFYFHLLNINNVSGVFCWFVFTLNKACISMKYFKLWINIIVPSDIKSEVHFKSAYNFIHITDYYHINTL